MERKMQEKHITDKPECIVVEAQGGRLRIFNVVAAAKYAGVQPQTFRKIIQRDRARQERWAPAEKLVKAAYPELFKRAEVNHA
jgi:hypothetical protein